MKSEEDYDFRGRKIKELSGLGSPSYINLANILLAVSGKRLAVSVCIPSTFNIQLILDILSPFSFYISRFTPYASRVLSFFNSINSQLNKPYKLNKPACSFTSYFLVVSTPYPLYLNFKVILTFL